MAKRNAPQTNAYNQYLRACAHHEKVFESPDSTLEQRQQAELEVTQARRYLYNATKLRIGESVQTAFNRTYPELSA
jgi:hypothetical protein